MPRIHRHYTVHRRLNKTAHWLTTIAENCGWSAGWFWGLTVVSSAVLTLLQFADAQGQRLAEPWANFVSKLYANRLALAVTLLILQCLCAAVVFLLNRWQNFDRMKVEEILRAAVRHHFPQQDASKHIYRATLFKIRRFLGFGSWLGIVARTGPNYSQSNTIFSLNRMKQSECTGVAGECAWENAAITIGPLDPTDLAYLDSGWIAECEHSAFNVKATVFFAIPIVRISGKPWGVMVLDTTDEQCAPGPSRSNRSPDKLKTDLSLFALALQTALKS